MNGGQTAAERARAENRTGSDRAVWRKIALETAGRLLTLHNLWWLLSFVAALRTAISAGRFAEFRAETHAIWG